MQALALTDHHGLAGAVEFYEACLGFDVQPILGLEIDVIALASPGVPVGAARQRSGRLGEPVPLEQYSVGRGRGWTPLPFERFTQEWAG